MKTRIAETWGALPIGEGKSREEAIPAPRWLKVGSKVRLVDPHRIAARFWDAAAKGIKGAGGATLPRALLDKPAIIASVGAGKNRVLVHWQDHGDSGMWLDSDQVQPADVKKEGILSPRKGRNTKWYQTG